MPDQEQQPIDPITAVLAVCEAMHRRHDLIAEACRLLAEASKYQNNSDIVGIASILSELKKDQEPEQSEPEPEQNDPGG